MKYWPIYFVLTLLSFSCSEKHDDGAISISLQKRDSLLLEYIAKEFYVDYNPEVSYFLPRQRDFREQLKYLRKDTASDYTHERRYKNYLLKSFNFDSQGWPPFAIEVSNTNNQFISIFSFTDEKFCRSINIDMKSGAPTSIIIDSALSQKINLDKNINLLLQKLNIQKEDEITEFIELIFVDLLSMKKISTDSLQKEIKFFGDRINLTDSIRQYVEKEQSIFLKKGDGTILMVRSQIGGVGYWRFWIERKGNLNVVKSAFLNDMFHKVIFM